MWFGALETSHGLAILMRNRWLYCLLGSVPFWICTLLDAHARRARPMQSFPGGNPDPMVDAATARLSFSSPAASSCLLLDFKKRHNE
jgi:hypothetical protein